MQYKAKRPDLGLVSIDVRFHFFIEVIYLRVISITTTIKRQKIDEHSAGPTSMSGDVISNTLSN